MSCRWVMLRLAYRTNTPLKGSIMLGHNIAGEGVILGAEFVKGKDAFLDKNKARYADTPVFDPDIIPSGRYVHIGDGVWLRRCSDCEDFTLSYGSIIYLREHAQHELTHGGNVLGANVPLLR
jgi:hypothetical protein